MESLKGPEVKKIDEALTQMNVYHESLEQSGIIFQSIDKMRHVIKLKFSLCIRDAINKKDLLINQ